MRLTLRPHEQAQRPACAALLRGRDPAAWLRELSRWQLPAGALRCYLVPESLASVQVAGLLVLVEGHPLPPDVAEPYGVVAGRLYVPTHATLWPAATPAELADALLWPRQLLHPHIGLVGFEATDEVPLAALLAPPPPRPTAWHRALPGPTPLPTLQALGVQPPSAAEVLRQLQGAVGTAPLAELPGLADGQPSALRRTADALHRQLLRLGYQLAGLLPPRPSIGSAWGGPVAGRPGSWVPGWLLTTLKVLGLTLLAGLLLALLLNVLAGHAGAGLPGGAGVLLFVLIRLLSRGFTGGNGSRPPDPVQARARRRYATPGWRERLGKWAQQKLGTGLAELEKRRHRELEGLLQLFRDNPALALQYAIPLDGGRYLGRGTAAPGAQLGWRSTAFSLGGLGGGQATDAWDLGAYREQLRQQYQAAAEAEAAAGRHHQAAYIQAQLLGDFRAAAQALEQGGHFREAAALWREHLHNLPAAAECLERGGLLLEAATLFAELQQHERAGDLYQRLQQPELAARHYERALAALTTNHDYPAAGRLLATKLRDPTRARELLLLGWAEARQPEPCLRQYFDLVAADEALDPGAAVRAVYAERTPPGRRAALLQVLAGSVAPHPALLPAAREVAYEVIGTEAAAGNHGLLSLLPSFEPHDPLLAADCSRFATRPARPGRPRPALPPALRAPQLDGTIRWERALVHQQQLLALGRRDNHLHLARANWYGHVEYYSWLAPLPPSIHVLLLADEQQAAGRVVLRPSTGVALEPKTLPRNKHFPKALQVESPSWLPAWPQPVAVASGTELLTLELGEATQLVYCAAGGRQQAVQRWSQEQLATAGRLLWPSEMFFAEDRCFTYFGRTLNWLHKAGEVRTAELPDALFDLARSPYARLLLAATTETTVLLWRPLSDGDAEPFGARLPASSLPDGALVSFIGLRHLIAHDSAEMALYQFSDAEIWLETHWPAGKTATQDDIVAVLPTTEQHQYAVLEASGRLTLRQLPPGK